MKAKEDMHKIGTFNAQEVLSTSKQQTLADDFRRYKMAILYVQEIYLKG